MPPRFSVMSASLKATSTELQAERAIATRSGDEERKRDIEAKLDHIADLHQRILGRPIRSG